MAERGPMDAEQLRALTLRLFDRLLGTRELMARLLPEQKRALECQRRFWGEAHESLVTLFDLYQSDEVI